MTITESRTRSLRPASIAGGVSLLLMIVFAFFGNFVALESLITPGDAARTAADVADSEPLFRWGIASLMAVVILDVVVAAALYALFEGVDRTVSMTAAWFRVAYAAVFLIAIAQLAMAAEAHDEPGRMMARIEAFEAIWSLGLGVFGVHLLLIGWLAYRSGFMAKVFGILLVIAGLGYLIDGLGRVAIADYSLELSLYTFFGELALMFWLFIRGTRLSVDG